MNSKPWHERVALEISKLPPRTLLYCTKESGIDSAVHRLIDLETPRVTMWVDENNSSEPLGSTLSRATAAGLGTTLFGKGTSIEKGVHALVEYQRALSPVAIVIGWAHHCKELVTAISRLATDSSRVLIVADSQLEPFELDGFASRSGNFLRMTYAEAVAESRGSVPDAILNELFQASRGNFSTFKVGLMKTLENSTPAIAPSEHWNWGDAVSVDAVLDALIHHKRWPDAFDLACSRASERLIEFVDNVGHYYSSRGSYSFLWSRLDSLPPDVKRNEKIAYWLVTAGLAINRHEDIIAHTNELLRGSPAPEIWASTAVAIPNSDMLERTAQALETLRSPATLRAHGFALAWAGKREEPIGLFREALRLAEREKADHVVVACGIDIAEVEVRKGRYKSAVEWTDWAIGEYSRRGLNDELRRLSALATNSFARLLRGESVRPEVLQPHEDGDAPYMTVPGYEAVTSTLADIAFVAGDLDRALMLYESIHIKTPLEVHCFTGLNILGVLVAQQDWRAARKFAERAYAISRSSSSYERALGVLMLGIAHVDLDLAVAEQHLGAALEGMVGVAAELHVAQAATWLAIVRLLRGRRREAVQSLLIGEEGLREMGSTGWRLICFRHPMTERVAQLWSENEHEYNFKFLGSRGVQVGDSEVGLSIRAAEILAILAIHASGLSGDRLHTYLYGDARFSRSALKASVSRLREIVPIGSNPYRIDATFSADFITVLELVSNGELQRALNSYTGELLPESESPLIREWRTHIDESIRAAVISSRDTELLIQLATILDDDLELWELAKDSVSPSDHRRPVINARIRRIRASWGASSQA